MSLRAFGYDLPTALADIVDNSIIAGARNVWIDMRWSGRASRIVVRDDGTGMSEDERRQAMRPGSRSPLASRETNDPGPFGLGSKTALISQCCCLIVLAKALRSSPALRRRVEATKTSERWLPTRMDMPSEADQAGEHNWIRSGQAAA